MVKNNQNKHYDATVRYIDVGHGIWGKDIDALKVKITQTKPNPVAGDMIKITKELPRTIFAS